MDFSFDLPFDPENLPEDMPEEVKAHIRTQHAAHQHHQMMSDQAAHDVVAFIKGLDEHDLMILRGLVNALAMGPETTHGYYFGVMSTELEKFGICLACGKKHDDQLAAMLAGEDIAETVKEMTESVIPDTLHKQTGTPGCSICGRDNDHGTHTALEHGGHLSHRYWPAEMVMQYPEEALLGVNDDDQAWANFTRRLDPEDLSLLAKYNMSLTPRQYPKVTCNGCGTQHPDMADRMREKPGVDGCSGCQQKEKFG